MCTERVFFIFNLFIFIYFLLFFFPDVYAVEKKQVTPSPGKTKNVGSSQRVTKKNN